ncbi:hypothetical protein GCM10010954_10870 [Halobacillus andaensis]|uniref:Uncharacterized protein n=1 Tax=Halobacillus andaensis TaxID=1176239 RepID=A0A917B2M3_HALAA|nr:hypothetical protein [Halobacillus andaensis]MBP2003879.1 hypothetical protein [Halobacillus andaensis]GGF13942.1 hypothetical protein GCM10010954_10870 [Halobacillus andaensis]
MDVFFYITIIVALTLMYNAYEKKKSYEVKAKEIELEHKKVEVEKLRLEKVILEEKE